MRKALLLMVAAAVAAPGLAKAEVFDSSNFQILDPVLHHGGFSSSQSYRLFGSVGQPFTGVSDSVLYDVRQGFLYFRDPAKKTPPGQEEGEPGGGGPILDIFQQIVGLISPCGRSDLNCDRFVDIYDAGILFYWWEKPLEQPTFASALASVLGLGRPSPDSNKDKAVDIYDLSIMFADWTGSGREVAYR